MNENKNETRNYFDECETLLTRMDNALCVIELSQLGIDGPENIPYANSISCALSELKTVYDALDHVILEWDKSNERTVIVNA